LSSAGTQNASDHPGDQHLDESRVDDRCSDQLGLTILSKLELFGRIELLTLAKPRRRAA
jgi:hypothetical protein